MEQECSHENVWWISGEVGAIISLNGDIVAECLDCGMVAREGDV